MFAEGEMSPIHIYLDACAFWAPTEVERKAVDRLFELEESKAIPHMLISRVTRDELDSMPSWARAYVRERCESRIWSWTGTEELEQRKKLARVQDVLFTDRPTLKKNEQRDVVNVFEAKEGGATFFVTCDKRDILSKQDEIRRELNLSVASPSECLDEVLRKLKWFKEHERKMRRRRGDQG